MNLAFTSRRSRYSHRGIKATHLQISIIKGSENIP
jgi:hypothetical protein